MPQSIPGTFGGCLPVGGSQLQKARKQAELAAVAISARAGLPGRTAWTWRELDFLLRVRIEQRFGPRRIPWWDQLLTETGKEVLGECW